MIALGGTMILSMCQFYEIKHQIICSTREVTEIRKLMNYWILDVIQFDSEWLI
jgi:hypothetical protein